MRIQELKGKVGVKIKIVFKPADQRYPMIGKIVNLKDYKDLSSKGMVRFVNQTKLDFWKDDDPCVGLTKIYCVSDFSQIISM